MYNCKYCQIGIRGINASGCVIGKLSLHMFRYFEVWMDSELFCGNGR